MGMNTCIFGQVCKETFILGGGDITIFMVTVKEKPKKARGVLTLAVACMMMLSTVLVLAGTECADANELRREIDPDGNQSMSTAHGTRTNRWTDIHLCITHNQICLEDGWLPNAETEQIEVEALISDNTDHLTFTTFQWNTDQINQGSLQHPTVSVFHWIGHGGRRGSWPLGSRPLLVMWPNDSDSPDGECPAFNCGRGFDRYYGRDVPSNIDHIDFVFLNSCYSATSGSWYRDSLFDGFLDNGARCIMGWDDTVYDVGAYRFAYHFYYALTTEIWTVNYAREYALDEVIEEEGLELGANPIIEGFRHNPYN